jgi:uncharacterized protein YutE (UPF0331/DUF86 family)/predicted nucleotidyltransferase
LTEDATGIRLADIEGRLDELSRTLARDGIRLACLFGSVLQQPLARDIDLAVLFKKYRFEKYLETLEVACRALGTRRVDLVVLDRSSARLKLQALLEGKLLFAEVPTAQAEAVAEALYEYEDYRQFMVQYRQLLDRRCQEGLSVADRRMDRERVEGYLSTLDEAMIQLRRLGGRFTSFEEFRSDVDTRELCVHYLRVALESVLDICRHFLAVVGVSLTELDTTNLIELAGEKGLLESAFAHRIRGMAGMRNAIVHVYWRLDYQAIYQAVTEGLVDFDEFARQVQTYLGSVQNLGDQT